MELLDLLFPKYCVNCKKLGSYLCSNCFSYLSFSEGSVCGVCHRASFDELTHPNCRGWYKIDGIFTGIQYEGIVKKLIYKFKYNPYLSDLHTVFVDLLYEALIQKEEFIRAMKQYSNEAIVFVPIPLHPSKLRKRGYNQAELLAKGLAKKFGLPTKSILKRVKDTETQVGLDKEKRQDNIKNAFSLSPNPPAGGSQSLTIFLVDDVVTTGSTLAEAAKLLKKNGVKKVFGIALARD